MHHHLAFFWLQEGLPNSALKEFEKGLETLIHIPLVLSGHFGKAANTHRTVVENSYSYGLSLTFKDLADHNLYQIDKTHNLFVDQNQHKWTRVQVFDIETESSHNLNSG